MQKYARLLALLALLLASTAASSSTGAFSQEATPDPINRMVSVYPVNGEPGDFVTVTVNAGDTSEFTIVVGNAGNISQTIRAYPIPAITSDNGGFAAQPYGTEPDNITAWMDFEETQIDLDPGAGQEFTIQVTVPADVPPGEYVTSIAAEQAEAFGIEGTDVLTQRVRKPMPVLIIVPGEFQHGFELSEFTLESRQDILVGRVKIENTGTAIVRPVGEARLLDHADNIIAVAEMELGSIYSGTTANVYVGWQNVPTFESYSLEITLTDPDNGATASATFNDLVPITEHVVEAAATPVPELAFSQADLAPLTDDVPPSMLSFEGAISNPADPIENARVSIVTYQDGEEVDRYPILQGVTLESGSTPLEARYALPGGFTEGTYTFAVTIELGSSGSQTVLVSQTIDFEVTVDD